MEVIKYADIIKFCEEQTPDVIVHRTVSTSYSSHVDFKIKNQYSDNEINHFDFMIDSSTQFEKIIKKLSHLYREMQFRVIVCSAYNNNVYFTQGTKCTLVNEESEFEIFKNLFDGLISRYPSRFLNK
jgi:hypothetical protein